MAAKKKPSAAQLAARAKFVAMVRAKSKAKKSATKKTTVKKAAPKKAAKKKVVTKKASTHKDTKSHNVRISVVSGVNPYAINEIQRLTRYNDELQRFIINSKDKLKNDKSLSDFNKGVLKISISRLRYLLSDNKKRIIQLKKHIK